MLRLVEHQPVGAELLGALRPAAAQHGLDAGNKLHHAEGLDKIVVRAEIEPADALVFRALGRGHDDGDIGKLAVRAHPAQQFQSVHAREHHVEHDKLGPPRAQRLPEARPVLKALGLKAGGAQGVNLDIADAGVIFHAPDHCFIPPYALPSPKK